MRILLIQRFDLSSVSCARRVICQAEELLQRGHEVILTDFAHQQRRNQLPPVASLDRLGARIQPLERAVIRFPNNLSRLARLDPQPDIVHVWKAYPDASLLAYALARRWKVPLHYDWDDWERGISQELTGSPLAGWVAGLWDRHFLHLAHTVTTASDFLREKAIEWGVAPHRIWEAPVGADLLRFYPRTRDESLLESLKLTPPTLVYSGQLEVASYAEQAVAALVRIRESIPSACLLVLGGGRKLPSIRSYANQLGLEKQVIFTDYIDGDEIPRYLSVADCALAPFEENDVTRAKSPLKIAEYLAMGLPVVASNVGEAPRMIGEAGICVPCNESDAMAEAAVRILSSPEPVEKMKVAARQRAESRYNWRHHVDQLESAYQWAMEKYKR